MWLEFFGGVSAYPEGWDIESGAMQVTLTMLSIDIYPRTLAVSPRREWLNYTAPNSVTNWLHELLAQHLINTTKDMGESCVLLFELFFR